MDETTLYKLSDIEDAIVETTLDEVYTALVERGFNPVNQIVGYLTTGDPSYITSNKDAKALGMDLGTRTLGLATSDRLGMIASPYKTIRYEDINALVDEVLDIINKEKIEVLVLGYPKNMNNTEGPAVERTNNFKSLLESKTNLEINLIDERLSTVEAENYLLEEDMSRKNRKGVIDAVAASVILDTYLRQQEIKNRGE